MALGNQCRFNGMLSRFYSVAEHSCLCYAIKPCLEVLLHDAHEAYVGDLISPIKETLPEYRELCNQTQAAIAQRFKLRPAVQEIEHADRFALAIEVRYLYGEAALCAWTSIGDDARQFAQAWWEGLEYLGPREASLKMFALWGSL